MNDPHEAEAADDLSPDAFLENFREYLENEVNWDPIVPSSDELSRDERWERICEVLMEQMRQAGQSALDAIPTIRRLDKEDKLTGRIDRFERYLEEEDFTTAVSLFMGEQMAGLIEMGNRAFLDGSVTEAKEIYAFAQLANPLSVEPLIGQITVEWEERGPERAADLYGAVVDVFQHPLLDMFAADCYIAANQPEKARNLLERALGQVTGEGDFREDHGDLEAEIRSALADETLAP